MAISNPCGPNYALYSLPGIWLALITVYAWLARESHSGNVVPVRTAILVGFLDTLKLLLLSLILLVPFLILTPAYQCYNDRSKVTEGLALAAEKKTFLVEYYSQKHSFDGLVEQTEFSVSRHVDYVSITTSATIVVAGTTPGYILTLSPVIVGDTIDHWVCIGVPAKIVPANCRNEPTLDDE